MKTTEDKESTASVEGSKVKEENVEVAGEKCWKGKWLSVLKLTGEIFNCFPMKVILKLSRTVNMLFQSKMEIFLRDLDPPFHRPVCYGGLHSLRHCILQQLAVG